MEKEKIEKQESSNRTSTIRYTKEQLVKSKTFLKERDLLTALLKEKKTYTIEETKRMIKQYLESEVH